MASPTDYVFLTDLYDARWASVRFYVNMMERIRAVLERQGGVARAMSDVTGVALGASSVVVVDAAAIQALHRRKELPWLLETRFVLIIGENPDRRRRSFMGWDGPLRELTFAPGNLLRRVIQAAARATWQNERMRDLLHEIKRPDDVLFFPIAGYEERDVIAPRDAEKDIDILIYGAMSYRRRADFVMNLLMRAPHRRIVICNNVFELDDLIVRAKVIVHVNSLDDCYQVPYAKIVKPLANHKILFVEQTAELDRSDLRPLIHTFAANRFADFLADIETTLNRYPEAQARLDWLDPRRILQERYNFDEHVRRLFAL